MKTVYISFSGHIDQYTTDRFLSTSFDAVNQGFEHLYYIFTTPGGQVAAGIALYNTLKALPVRTTFHNVGNVESIGNAIFLAGNKRKASTFATFMFHGVGFDIQNTRLEERQIRENLECILSDQKRIGAIMSEQTNLSIDEIEELFGKASTKECEYALDKGIIHEIEELAIPIGSNVLQVVL